jgi:Sulfotransferase domain
METVPTPNVFIVGAPKSGTTALYSYLRRHPEIFMSKLKEPQFFAADICGDQRAVRTLSEYLALFREARAPVIGEASTCYLGSSSAARHIREFCRPARIIAMLRNPIEVMYAEHSERLFDGVEHIADFSSALDSNEKRKWRSGRFKCQCVIRPSYRELTRFSDQIKRFINRFARQNICIIIYDDFAKDPALTYKKVLSFLQVSPNHQCAFDVIHANRQIRSERVQDFLNAPPDTVRGLARTVLPRPIRQAVGRYLNRLNVKVTARPMLDQPFRKRLQLEYEPEVQLLSELLDRDLTHWIRD